MNLLFLYTATDKHINRLVELLPTFTVDEYADIWVKDFDNAIRGVVTYWASTAGVPSQRLLAMAVPPDTVVIAYTNNTVHAFSSVESLAVWVQLTQTPYRRHP